MRISIGRSMKKVRGTGSNRNFGVTKDSRIYFDLSRPSGGSSFGSTKAKPVSFDNPKG